MVKDPLDNGRTKEMFPDELPVAQVVAGKECTHNLEEPATVKVSGFSDPELNGEFEIPVEPVPEAEPEYKPTSTPEQMAAALAALRARPYSERHPELGKMIKCQVHGFRHREFEFGFKKCEQKFTHVVNGFEIYREEWVTDPEGKEGPNGEVPKKGTLVPDLRTAISPDGPSTIKQIVGRAAFAKRRFNPHISAFKREFAETVKAFFQLFGFEVPDKDASEEVQKTHQKNLQMVKRTVARVLSQRPGGVSFREYRRRGLV